MMGADGANGANPGSRFWFWLSMFLLALLLAAGFFAYSQPGLILDFVNLRYCA